MTVAPDTDASNGPIKQMAHRLPIRMYRNLVAAGGGRMRGAVMPFVTGASGHRIASPTTPYHRMPA
jgi:hypothetical protein